MGLFKSVVKKITGYREMEFKVTGVTFKNGRKSRQALLRALKWHDEPFDKEVEITFERYEFEGELAIGVYANKQQIGNVPRELIEGFDKNWKKRYMIEHYEVLGSGVDMPFGFRVKVLFE